MKISIRNTIDSIIKIGLIIILILSFNSVYLREWTGASLKNTTDIWVLSVSLIAFYIVFNLNSFVKIFSRKKSIYSLMIYLALFFISYIFVNKSGPSLTTFVRFYGVFMPLSIVYFLIIDVTFSSFLKRLSNIIYILMIGTSILWLIGPVLGIIGSNGQKLVYWGQYRYYDGYCGLLFTYYRGTMNLLGREVLKNTSIFTEAPMSGMIFTLGYALYLSIDVKRNRPKIISYLICIATTGSTTSIILSVLIFVYDTYKETILNRLKRYRDNKVYYLTLFFGGIIIIVFGTIFIRYMLQQKATTSSNSYNDHFSDFINGIQLIGKYIFTGVGMDSELNYINHTSGAIRVLTQGGLLFFTLYLIPFIALFRKSRDKKNRNFKIFVFTLGVQFVLVICQDTLLFLFLLAMGYAMLFNSRKEKKCITSRRYDEI